MKMFCNYLHSLFEQFVDSSRFLSGEILANLAVGKFFRTSLQSCPSWRVVYMHQRNGSDKHEMYQPLCKLFYGSLRIVRVGSSADQQIVTIIILRKADSLHPPGAGPGEAYLNGFAGGGVFAFGLAGNVLSVP